jgi:hypothetical protein
MSNTGNDATAKSKEKTTTQHAIVNIQNKLTKLPKQICTVQRDFV